MPELPEVEVVRRGLARHLPGREIHVVDVRHPRAVRRQVGGARAFSAELLGSRILEVRRRGKYLWCVIQPEHTEEPRSMVMHLGMSGQLLLPPVGQELHVHTRIRFAVAGDRDLWFVDQRTFGGLFTDDLEPDQVGDLLPTTIMHIARDPLDPLFDPDFFVREVRRRSSGIKRALLDQSLISGIGNIYADEALWRSGLHFDRTCSSLSRAQVLDLLTHSQHVMGAALAQGGTSFDALYVNVNGESGYFDRSLDAYGRAGQPCRRCGREIIREAFMNRSSFRCPSCQRKPRRKIPRHDRV